MASTPIKQTFYMVCYHDKKHDIPFYPSGGFHSAIDTAKKALQREKKKHPRAFVVKVTEERIGVEA